MRVEDLPSNVLLMRILGGLKQDAPNKENTVTLVSPERPNKSPVETVLPSGPVVTHQLKADADNTLPQFPSQQIMSRPVLGAPLPHKYLPQNVCHAKAIFDFQSNVSGDLAFKKGDVIVLRRRVDQNWFYGHLNGREGAFPVNHVQIIVPLPVPQCRSLFDFRMGPNEEEGCLSFSKGQIITVLRRIDQNWAEGRIGECIGIFPINFVEMNSLAKQLMGGNKDTGRTSLSEAMTTAGQAPAPVTPNAIDQQQQLQQRLPPMPAKVEMQNYPAVVRRAPPHASSMQNSSRRHSAEILNPIVSAPPNVCIAEATTRKSSGESPRLLPYVAVFAYKPQKSDELELIKGGEFLLFLFITLRPTYYDRIHFIAAQYYVSDRCQDGWLRGMNSARKAGVFPGNHVVPLSPGQQPGHPELNAPPNQRTSNPNSPATGGIATPPPANATPASPPILPPRNQTSVVGAATVDPVPGDLPANEKKDSINLIKRITNNLKRSKSPPAAPTIEENSGTPRSSHPPRLLQSMHGRSGSCPSQLLDLSALKITPANSNSSSNQPRPGLPPNADAQHAMSFGSQRVRGQKERAALHNLHRQLGERKEDLTALGSLHRKSNSLDAGRIISSSSSSTSSSMAVGGDQNGNTRNTSGQRSAGHHHQVKEK